MLLARFALAGALALAPTLPALAAEPAPPDPLADQKVMDPETFAIRHRQLTLHQGFGLATLASMAVTAGLGWYSQQPSAPGYVTDAHLVAAGLTSGLYLTAATLELTAPRRLDTGEPENWWDTAEIHERLSWLHAAGMTTTVGLGLYTIFGSTALKDYHAIAGFTTLGLLALSAGVIAFGE